MFERIEVNLAGNPLSGKSKSGRHLEHVWKFRTLTGSDVLQQEASKRGLILKGRPDYTKFQRHLRCGQPTFIADAVAKIDHPRVANIGARNRLDIEASRRRGGVTIALVCPIEIRFDRRPADDPKYPDNFEEFLAVEEREYNDPDPFGQHTQWAIEHADHVIDTSGSVESMLRDLDNIMGKYLPGQQI